jgi:catechol 2,3-dioxygenase-like lactoylglutathione lyase family enzyme
VRFRLLLPIINHDFKALEITKMQVTGILETCLYAEDLEVAIAFYQRLFGFEVMARDDRFCAFNVAGRDVLLIFKRGASTKPMPVPGGVIPPHDSQGQLHLAFSVSAADLPGWESRLVSQGIDVESTVTWPQGGTSLYFRDPDQHLIELATPGIWPNY